MQNSYLQKIAELTGKSKPTVCKALNHCGGIDSKTRDAILTAAGSCRAAAHHSSPCELYCILPDIPHFFWDGLRDATISAAAGLRCKYNIYTRLHDKTVANYLEEAREFGARVILVAADGSGSIAPALKEAAQHAMLILLSEYADIPNAFYFGSNAFADGERLGRYYAENKPGKLYIALSTPNLNCEKRVKGFLSAIRCDAEFLQLPSLGSTFAAATAAALSALAVREPLCLYCPDGLSDEIMLAVHKAGLSEQTVLLCHDVRPANHLTGRIACRIGATVTQDLPAQARAAVSAARVYIESRTFPSQKMNECPSTFTAYL